MHSHKEAQTCLETPVAQFGRVLDRLWAPSCRDVSSADYSHQADQGDGGHQILRKVVRHFPRCYSR